MADFAELLRDARLAKAKREGKDVRPADVARAVDITRSAYGHWEAGRSRPKDLRTVERLASYLGVEVDDLGLDIRSLPPVFESPKVKQRTRHKAQPHSTPKKRGRGFSNG